MPANRATFAQDATNRPAEGGSTRARPQSRVNRQRACVYKPLTTRENAL